MRRDPFLSPFIMDIDIGPDADPEFAILDNRLPFMDLKAFCAKHGYTYYMIWRAGYGDELKIDNDYWGDYAEQCFKARIKLTGGETASTGLAGKSFSERSEALMPNVQNPPPNASDAEKKMAEFAKAADVRGCWAIFRDGAVFEFGQSAQMSDLPREVIDGIGGSTGVKAAAKAVQAVSCLPTAQRIHTCMLGYETESHPRVPHDRSCALAPWPKQARMPRHRQQRRDQFQGCSIQWRVPFPLP